MSHDNEKPLDPKKALIISSRSFLGKFLRRNFLAKNMTVLGTSRSASQADSDCEQLDVNDPMALGRLLNRFQPDWVVQCSGATNSHDPAEHYQSHVAGTLQLLKGVFENVPKARVVLLGSAAEYGNVQEDNFPITEDSPCNPTSFFGASKLAQAHLAIAAAAQWELAIAQVRPFNICGPNSPMHYFLGSLIKRAFTIKSENLSNALTIRNGMATRDFVDVRDVAQAIVGLLTSNVMTPGVCKILNIASGRETSLIQVGEILCNINGLTIQHESDSSSRTGVQRSCGSSGRLSSLTGWEPTISLEKSILDQWNEYSLTHS